MLLPLLLLTAAALFGTLFLLNNLIKAITGSRRVTFWEIWLAFLTAILIAVALILNYLALIPTPAGTAPLAVPLAATTPDPAIDQLALIAGLGLAALSLVIALIEALRPPRLARSRGVLGIFTGGLIAVSAIAIPFAAAYLSLGTPTPNADPIGGDALVIAPSATANVNTTPDVTTTPDPAAPTRDPNQTATATPDPEAAATFRALFRAVRDVLADEISGVDEVAIFTQLDQGVPLAQIVRENGGDVQQVIRRISAIMQDGLRASIAAGDTNPLQGALLISQMDTFVTLAVNANLNELGGRFGGPTPTGTRPSLLTLLTETPIAGETAVTTTPALITPTTAASSTPAPTSTPPPTVPPTIARTLPPTVTPRPPIGSPSTATVPPTDPTATVDPAVTVTAPPSPTPTIAAPAVTCAASTAFNLRLRAEPSTEADTLITIPFSTALLLDARTSDSAWWSTTYEGQAGWVDGEFLLLSAACAALPVR